MKSIIVSILMLSLLYASNNGNEIKVKIIEKIFSSISIENGIVVWSDNEELLEGLEVNKNYQTTKRCEEATLLILEEKSNLKKECEYKSIFVLNYNLLTDVPKSFGALFWKKGRPNIIFIESRVEADLIKVSKDLEQYMEEKVW